MIRFLGTLLKHSILAALVMAMLALPFVHRAGAEPVSHEIRQYIALGGYLADICGDSDGHMSGGCESCNIVATMMLSAYGYLALPASIPKPLEADASGGPSPHRPPAHNTPPVRAPPRA